MTDAVLDASSAPITARKSRGQCRPATGLGLVALAIAFNVPFSILAATYDYPDVLRGPAGVALDMFAGGGAGLILTWHAFALTALAMAPAAFALSITAQRLATRPALAIGAAVMGSLAGLAQAIGLWRWVFVVPGLAHTHADAAATPEAHRAAEVAFELINQYGGVAIGEHLGQTLTAMFVGAAATLQWGERKRVSAIIGMIAALVIAIGTGEGVAIAIGQSGALFAKATIAGFMTLTLWLLASGLGFIRGERI